MSANDSNAPSDSDAHVGCPSVPSSAFVVEVVVTGETLVDAWEKLVSVVSFACESKQRNGQKWPLMVYSSDGKISVKPNTNALAAPTENEDGN